MHNRKNLFSGNKKPQTIKWIEALKFTLSFSQILSLSQLGLISSMPIHSVKQPQFLEHKLKSGAF